MDNAFCDRLQLECQSCRHRWIIVADKAINMYQYYRWLMDVLLEHNIISRQKHENN